MQVNKKRALLVKVCQPESAESQPRDAAGAPASMGAAEENDAKLPAAPAPGTERPGTGDKGA